MRYISNPANIRTLPTSQRNEDNEEFAAKGKTKNRNATAQK
jgi:hypothetical protein